MRKGNRSDAALVAVVLAALTLTPALATPASTEPTATTTPSAGEQEDQRPPVEMRRYPVREGNMSSAYAVAEALCQEYRYNSPGGACSFDVTDANLIFIATPELHDRLARELAEIDVPPRTQRFHIVVLETADGAGVPDDLHEGAIAALEDLRSFLPYSGFRVLTNGWLETARQGQTSLSGPGNFEMELAFQGDPRNGDTLMVEHFELTAIPLSAEEIRTWQRSREEPLPRRVVLRSNFGIDVGETKVLGTSKLDGDGTALVVLLTAVE